MEALSCFFLSFLLFSFFFFLFYSRAYMCACWCFSLWSMLFTCCSIFAARYASLLPFAIVPRACDSQLNSWTHVLYSKHRNSNYIHKPRITITYQIPPRNVSKITHDWLTSWNNHKYRSIGESKRKIVLNRTVVSWFGLIVSNDWLNVVFSFNSVRSLAIKLLERFPIDRLMTD